MKTESVNTLHWLQMEILKIIIYKKMAETLKELDDLIDKI